MATFTWKGSVSGLWGDDSLWAGGLAPNAGDADVSLSPVGPYAVTVGGGTTVSARSLTGVSGVTLSVAGSLALAGSASLARVEVAAGGRLSSQATLKVTDALVNDGTVSADTAGAFFQLTQGTITNHGSLEAPVSGSYLFVNGAVLSNLSGGVLSGGTYLSSGGRLGGSVATIDIARAGESTEITTLAATVVLRFVNSTLMGRAADGSSRSLESTLGTIAPAGELRLLDGRNYSGTPALSVGGRLVLGGGTLTAGGGLLVAAGGTLEGFGQVASPLSLAGTLHVAGGVLRLSGAMTGSGAVLVDKGATLQLPGGTYGQGFGGEGTLRAAQGGNLVLTGAVSGPLLLQAAAGATIDLGVVSGATLVFGGTNATLSFAGAASFTGMIAGFQTTDVLRLEDVAASAASAISLGGDSNLVLTTAGGSVSLHLAGDYGGRSFQVAPDGSGGTLVTVAGVSFAPGAANWATPTLTWSFAQANYPAAFASFSGFVDAAAQPGLAALWRAAFARWSAVSGLQFVEVADTPGTAGQADIRVGWGNFGNPPAGEIGQANFSYLTDTRQIQPGALVRLQDPSITPLSDGGGGVQVYQSTSSSAYQVMLHEIGHALGLDHAAAGTDPAAVMAPTASGTNRDLDVSDIAGIRALYAAVATPVAPATLSIATLAASKAEGTGGSTGFTFTVTRAGDASKAATVDYTVTGSGPTPASAADFQGGSFPTGTLSFAAGETSQTLTLPVAADTAVEPDEGFTVTLAGATGATIATASAGGTILNDDATSISVAATKASIAEGASGSTTNFTFTVTRSETSLGAISLNYAVAPGAMRPANAADFVGNALPAGTVSFAADATQATITIAVSGDDVQEPNEDFTVTLSGAPAGATLATASAGGTILADEPILDMAALGGDGKVLATAPEYFSGPVAGVEKQLVLVTAENLTIAVGGPNWFIHTGTGDDAIAAATGTNVLDGGTGSNFLTGGSGADTFFVDARGTTLPIWSTVRGFDPGDQATLWGVSDTTHSITWADNEGAVGFKGLTLHAASPGNPDVLMTLPGFSTADLGTKLAVFTSNVEPISGSAYTFIFAL